MKPKLLILAIVMLLSALPLAFATSSLDINLTSYWDLDGNKTPIDQLGKNNFVNYNSNTQQVNHTNTSVAGQENECKNVGCFGIGSAPAGTETLSFTSGLKGWQGNSWSFNAWIKSHWIQVGDTPQEIWLSAEADSKMNLGYEFGGGACAERYGMMLGNGASWNILTDTSGGCTIDVTLFNWVMVTVTHNSSGYFNYVNGTKLSQSTSTASDIGNPLGFYIGRTGYAGSATQLKGMIDEIGFWNRSLTDTERSNLWNDGVGIFASDGLFSDIPPEITFYNMTSEGGEGCTNWNTDKSNACTTSDTTPTVSINTNKKAYCRIGVSDLNYTDMGSSRNCSGGGTKSLTCTLTEQDILTQETSYVYIGCQNQFGGENSTSTSRALKVSLSNADTESPGRNAIVSGIQNALISGYTIYTDQKVYARNSANNQSVGVFDKVVKWMNKIWAFNYITGNQSYVNMFNITPVLYTLEMTNQTSIQINTTVYQLIMDTK